MPSEAGFAPNTVGKIRKVLHFENEIEHKILVTYVIAKVSGCKNAVRTETWFRRHFIVD
ncbi:hypothetical protein [Neisseria meningitidis]|uniref:hypothetical protein n=1 Tax=Neisseria meningitidis TaxID=487 RepID=UPI001302B02A